MNELQNGAVTRTYAYGLEWSDSDNADRPVFGKASVRISKDQLTGGTWPARFYGYDGHGSTRFLTNMAGSVTDTYNYDAFGNVISSTGSTPNEFLFAGEQFDPALGFYYMRARYYRPTTGRFWTRDPIEGRFCCGMSWNPYSYVLDNPVNSTDPMGREVLTEYNLGKGAGYLQVYNEGNAASYQGHCIALQYGQIVALLEEAASPFGEVGPAAAEQVGANIEVCVENFLKHIISPVPALPLPPKPGS